MSARAARWWAAVLAAAAAAVLLAWLARLAGLPLRALAPVAAGLGAVAWLAVLVTVPWNLYFAARQAAAQIAVSRQRGIAVPPGSDGEARRIAARMLWLALGLHLGTAAAAAVLTYLERGRSGYYVAGFYLLATAARPATAYLAQLRERISALRRESTHPREDVVTLRERMDGLDAAVRDLRDQQAEADRRAAADLAHLRQQATADLARLEDAQAADRSAARAAADELGRRAGEMGRQINAALDGVTDQQDLLAGIRALARLLRAE